VPSFSILDSHTVLACQLLLAVVFSVVFFCMMRAYPQLRGLGSIATGFLFSAPGVLLIALRGSISDVASIVLANALILCAHLYFYLGILRFFSPQRKPSPAAIWSAVSTVAIAVPVIAWFAIVQPALLPRLFVISLSIGYISTLIALELLRQAAGRIAYRLFSGFMLLYTAIGLSRVVFAAFGVPPLLLHHGSLQAIGAAINIVFICALGIFFQLMIAGELTQAIEHRARHDLLTGTLNRHGIELRLAGELDRARRNEHPLSALLIDVDHFKFINDTHGHAAGDQALRSVAQCIARSLRSYDLLGRYGGDEFLLLLPETHAHHALEAAERIRSVVANSPLPANLNHRPTISVGITETLPLDNASTLLARADAALYDAKHAGRNCCRLRLASSTHPAPPPRDTDHPSSIHSIRS
jgi:diguanylate cyclase (GGDEF)-like protein